MSVDCFYEQCYYNVNKKCGIEYYVTVPDGMIQVPLYCPHVIRKEKE